jgi:glycosyltransferase involved in cell wall biosynthesis
VTVHVVLPGGVDDPAAPSGGNTYDRRICRQLAADGWSVRPVAVAGAWPHPDPADLRRLAAVLDATADGELVLMDGLVACAAPDVVAGRAGRLRLVVLVHLPLADDAALTDAAALDAGERCTLHAVDAVVATSQATRRSLLARHGLAPSRVQVAVPGVEAAPLTRADQAGTRLACVASLTPRKGHHVLIEALGRLADRPWTLVCAGPSGPDGHADRLRDQVDAAGLGERVLMVGPLPPEDLADLYARTDLLVLASRAEPYGMVVSEALARGIPVLATAVDGVPQALGRAADGSLPGLLVPPNDAAALADALAGWLADADLRGRLRGAARQRRATLPTWQQSAAALGAALQSVR